MPPLFVHPSQFILTEYKLETKMDQKFPTLSCYFSNHLTADFLRKINIILIVCSTTHATPLD
jgi:hypothetical protein